MLCLDMVKLDKIYTKGGDNGYTSLVGGERVKKSSKVIEAIGNVDELNAYLGLVVCFLKSNQKKFFKKIQNDLFDLGADLATPLKIKKNVVRIEKNRIINLENEIDNINSKLKPLTSFILPGGDQVSAYLHLARTVCRRCEINIVKLREKTEINIEIIKYINRLSDYLFVLARQTNTNEVLWIPLGNGES